jgi:hypothetical protein
MVFSGYFHIGDPMSEEMSFYICGKEFVLPTSPDPVKFPWENEMESKKWGKTKDRSPKGTMLPKRKRYRLVKKKK